MSWAYREYLESLSDTGREFLKKQAGGLDTPSLRTYWDNQREMQRFFRMRK